jgi:hypothetical protein
MRPVLLVPALLLAVGLTACSAEDTVSKATDGATKIKDCASLAADVLGTNLGRTPTPQEAADAKAKLDKRIDGIGDTTVKQAATTLRDRVADLQQALQSADQAKIQASVAQVKSAAQSTASACNLPVSAFTG